MEDNIKAFYKAYKLASRLNEGKAYSVSLPDRCDEEFPPLGNILIEGQKVEIGNSVINVVDGSIAKMYEDFKILTMLKEIPIRRYYNSNPEKRCSLQGSKNKGMGLLGYGWTLEYEAYCVYDGRNLTLLSHENKKEDFEKQGEKWINKDKSSLVKIIKEDYRRSEIVIKRAGFFYTYSFDGRLKSFSDQDKNFVELRYMNGTFLIKELQTSCGKRLVFEYKDNKLMKITDSIGRTVRYTYNQDFLIEVEQTNGGKYTFIYDEVHKKLKEVQDANKHIEFRTEYERHGKIVALYKGYGQNWEVKQDDRNKTMTFAYEDLSIIFKQDRMGRVKEIQYSNGETLTYEYDDQNNMISYKSRDGKQTLFAYNEYNQLTTWYVAEGKWERWYYNAQHLLLKIIKGNGYEKLFVYDQLEHLIEIKETLYKGVLAMTQYKFDVNGRMIEKIDSNKNRIQYSYKTNESIFPEMIYYPNGFVVERQYDKMSRLVKENSSDGEIHFKYNNKDLIIQKIYPNGLHDFKRYDLMGNLREVILPKEVYISNKEKRTAKKYTYLYDEENKLIQVTTPTGKIIKQNKKLPPEKKDCEVHYKYDYIGNILEKKVLLENNRGEKMIYEVTEYLYNKNNKLIKEKKGNQVTTYTYDDRNNLSSYHVNSGEDKKYFYKKINTLSKEIIKINEQKEQHILYTYNQMGLLEKKIELLALEDADLEGVDIKNISSIQIVTWFAYDENNQLIQITLPNGSILNLTYDEDANLLYTETNAFLKQKIKKELSEKESVNQQYDKHGRKIKTLYPTGEFELFEYDYANNISSYTNKKGEKIHYSYNSINKIKTILAASGEVTTFFYKTDGQLSFKTIT